VVKTQGRRGEVATEPHTDIPDRFTPGLKLSALKKDNSRVELQVEEVWPHKSYVVLKFQGIDSISDAEVLIGSELQVPGSERAELEAGWVYVSDLVGCKVFDSDREIGKVEEVKFGAGEAPLLEVKSGGTMHEIPYADAYLRNVDLEHKRIDMQLPEGMLELSAPLSADEKQQQMDEARKH
jgi:16S rRNA processing protein RimM